LIAFQYDFIKLNNLRTSLQGCLNITDLCVDTPSLNDDDLWILTNNLKALTRFQFISNSTTFGRITDEGLITISKNTFNLKHLIIKSLSLDCFSDRGFLALANREQKLLSFGLEFIDCSINQRSSVFDTQIPTTPNSPLLSPWIEDKQKFIDSLSSIIQSNIELEHLSLDWPIEMKEIIAKASKVLTKLKSIKIGNISCISEFRSLLSSNKNLKKLSMYEFNSKTVIEDLLQPLFLDYENKNLQHLECIGICDFQNIHPIINYFVKLQTLVFTPTTRYASYPSINKILDIPLNLRLLKKVALPIYDDETLISFADNCPDITYLDIQDGRAVTNQCIIIISSKLALTTLCLGFSTLLDHGIDSLIRKQHETLKELVLPTPPKITKKGFLCLAEGLKKLERLKNLRSDLEFGVLEQGVGMMERLEELSMGVLRGQTRPLNYIEIEQLKKVGKNLKHFSSVGQ
jgi:hypothetical protein